MRLLLATTALAAAGFGALIHACAQQYLRTIDVDAVVAYIEEHTEA